MIKPTHNKLIVKLPHTQEKIGSGLYIPEIAKHPPMEGIVLAIGTGFEGFEGLEVGTRVMFEQYTGMEVTDKDWGDVVLLWPKHLMAVLEK